MAGRRSIANLPIIREKVITKGRLSEVVLLDPDTSDLVFATKVNGKLLSSGFTRIPGEVVNTVLSAELTPEDFSKAASFSE